MTEEYVKELLEDYPLENVNNKFFESNNYLNGYIFVKESKRTEDFQDLIDSPESFNDDICAGEYDVLKGLYVSFNGDEFEELDNDETVHADFEITDPEKIKEIKKLFNNYLEKSNKKFNKFKTWIK